MFKAWPQEHSRGHSQAKQHHMLDLCPTLYKKAKEHYTRPFKTQSLVYTWEDILHFSCLCYPATRSHFVQHTLPRRSNTREQYFAIYFFLSYFAMQSVMLNYNPVFSCACRLPLLILCSVKRISLIPSSKHEHGIRRGFVTMILLHLPARQQTTFLYPQRNSGFCLFALLSEYLTQLTISRNLLPLLEDTKHNRHRPVELRYLTSTVNVGLVNILV